MIENLLEFIFVQQVLVEEKQIYRSCRFYSTLDFLKHLITRIIYFVRFLIFYFIITFSTIPYLGNFAIAIHFNWQHNKLRQRSSRLWLLLIRPWIKSSTYHSKLFSHLLCWAVGNYIDKIRLCQRIQKILQRTTLPFHNVRIRWCLLANEQAFRQDGNLTIGNCGSFKIRHINSGSIILWEKDFNKL